MKISVSKIHALLISASVILFLSSFRVYERNGRVTDQIDVGPNSRYQWGFYGRKHITIFFQSVYREVPNFTVSNEFFTNKETTLIGPGNSSPQFSLENHHAPDTVYIQWDFEIRGYPNSKGGKILAHALFNKL